MPPERVWPKRMGYMPLVGALIGLLIALATGMEDDARWLCIILTAGIVTLEDELGTIRQAQIASEREEANRGPQDEG